MKTAGGEQIFMLDGLFEDLLAGAAQAPSDQEAQRALETHLKEVIVNGDMERVMAMAMIVGATACTHPHLEDLANMIGRHAESETSTHEGHSHDEEHDKKDKRKTKKHRVNNSHKTWRLSSNRPPAD